MVTCRQQCQSKQFWSQSLLQKRAWIVVMLCRLTLIVEQLDASAKEPRSAPQSKLVVLLHRSTCLPNPAPLLVFRMCFQCCFALKSSCSAHFRMRKRREGTKCVSQQLRLALTRSFLVSSPFQHSGGQFHRGGTQIILPEENIFLPLRREVHAEQ